MVGLEVFGKEQRCTDGCDMMELTGTGAGVLSVRTGLGP
jgi:hypothetical protein